MTPAVRRTIRLTSALNAGLAVVFSPIPLVDELVLLPILGAMSVRIGKGHGLARSELPWKAIASTAVASLTARAVVNVTVAYIPGVAAIANAVSAVTLTQMFGGYVDEVCEHPQTAHVLSVKDVLDVFRRQGKVAIARP